MSDGVVWAIVPAGGQGVRMGRKKPGLPLAGQPILRWTLDVLEADELVKSWLSPTLYTAYTAVKRIEAAMFTDQDADYMCKRYHDAY